MIDYTSFLADNNCLMRSNISVNECNCFFPATMWLQQLSNFCPSFFKQLGFCCGNESTPVSYITNKLCTQENASCSLDLACSCLSRERRSFDLENFCFSLCFNGNSTPTTSNCSLHGRKRACMPTMIQKCRRNTSAEECGKLCSEDNSCVSIITTYSIVKINFYQIVKFRPLQLHQSTIIFFVFIIF